MNRAFWIVWLYEVEGCSVDELAAFLKVPRDKVVDRLAANGAIQAARKW